MNGLIEGRQGNLTEVVVAGIGLARGEKVVKQVLRDGRAILDVKERSNLSDFLTLFSIKNRPLPASVSLFYKQEINVLYRIADGWIRTRVLW